VPSSDGLGVVDGRARDVSRRASTSVGSAAWRLALGPPISRRTSWCCRSSATRAPIWAAARNPKRNRARFSD